MPGWLFSSLRGYQRTWLRGDLIAGPTVWAVLIPEALAYATIAGVSLVVGLYAAPGALLLYAAFGSSRHLITGPMSATAALSAATVSSYATAGSSAFVTMTAALAISAGLAALIAGLLRLGFLASFISEPVLKGFIVGLALTIIVGQLPALFGVEKGSGDFFQKLWDLISKLGQTQGLTLLVGVASLALILILRRVAPAVPRIARRGNRRNHRRRCVQPEPARRRDRRPHQWRPAVAGRAGCQLPRFRQARRRRLRGDVGRLRRKGWGQRRRMPPSTTTRSIRIVS
jgi:MFS superfamily sulfate permease-like transporter